MGAFLFLPVLLYMRSCLREVRFVSKGYVVVLSICKICSRNDMTKIPLELALNTNQSMLNLLYRDVGTCSLLYMFIFKIMSFTH